MAETENQVPDGVNAQGEPPRPGNEAVAAKTERPAGATAAATPAETAAVEAKPAEAASEPAETKPPRAEYEVVASKRLEPESEYLAEHYKQIGLDAAAGGKASGGRGSVPQARLSEASIQRIDKLASSQTKVYAAAGIGLGLLVGLTAAVLLLHPGTPSGASDMGDVNSAECGLKGHLTTEFKDERLAYHLTVEPGSAAQRAAFLTDLNSSPRPLSITIQAKDPFGAVMCSDTILVKYDPRNAPASASEGPLPKSAKAAAELATRNEIARGLNLARLEGQELDREHGKTLFQNELGTDGQTSSISAQGVLPCTKKQVDRFASWGFISNFPIVAKPAASQDAAADPKANVDTAAADDDAAAKAASAERAAAAAKARKKVAPPPLPPIFVEGDDSLVWYDPASGIIETSAGKAMLLDKSDAVTSVLKGRDLPIPIHYKCDQSGSCTFSALGLGVHHARLRR